MSLVNAKEDLSDSNFQRYIRNFGLNPKFRASELSDIAVLIENLQALGAKSKHFNEFFVGYSIQQISKEFDLLRFGSNFVLNIELKLESTEERIKSQLIQNAHYLHFLNVPVYHFTFVTKSKSLYKLENGHLIAAQMEELLELIKEQQIMYDVVIDELFDPVHYLVSPIEEPVSFMNNEYFLTSQQTTFKIEMMNKITLYREWIALEGGSGTGKTLLTYDMTKQYMNQGQSVTVVHCRPLKEGQRILNEQFGWNIVEIQNWNNKNKCDVLIIDEAHHLTREQLHQILQYEQRYQSKIIISYDPQHYFNGSEIIRELEKFVKLIHYELKIIIRYNKEIHTFINCLFDMSYESVYKNFKHISVQYFSSHEDAHDYLSSLQKQKWKIINVIESVTEKPTKTISSPDIIGQEYDHVAALIDDHFYYKTNLRLASFGINFTHEQPTKVLFQALTRTRKKLMLVIVNNEPVLKNVLSILQPKSSRRE